MLASNYEEFVASLIKPLVSFPDEVKVETFDETGNTIVIHVFVNPQDLGRVIGKKGRVANSIRTIAYALAAKNSQRLEVAIDSLE